MKKGRFSGPFFCSSNMEFNASERLCVATATVEFDAGAAPRAGNLLLRDQEKVTKEKAARGLAATRCPALLVISGPFVQLARQKAASLKHALSFP
jgi:hypothetical protein